VWGKHLAMAVLQSVLYFSGSVGFGYALLKLISQDESTYLKKYPETRRGHGVLSVHRATEAKKTILRTDWKRN